MRALAEQMGSHRQGSGRQGVKGFPEGVPRLHGVGAFLPGSRAAHRHLSQGKNRHWKSICRHRGNSRGCVVANADGTVESTVAGGDGKADAG
jgi:hypothetical protein